MTIHRQTTGRLDDSPTVFFHQQSTHRHDHWPTRQVTDLVLKNFKKSPIHSPTLTNSYYSSKMNERKSFCQPQNQFIRQSRQKDTKRRNNILFQASCLKLLKENCIQFLLGQQNYISNPRVSDFGTTDNGCDLWMFGFHFLTNSVWSFPSHMI